MSQSTSRFSGLLAEVPRSKRFLGWLAVIAVGFLVGLYGGVRVLLEGTVVLGISNQLPWGILISTYEFFLLTSAGIVVGIVALSVVFGVKRFDRLLTRSVLLALATLAAGLFTIVIGLGRPERPMVHAVINANPSSPIWWVIMFAGTFGAVVATLFVLVQTDWAERLLGDRVGTAGLTRLVGIAGLGVGLAVMVAAGLIFGTAQTRPYYGGALAPLYFVLTGIMSGVAAVGAVVAAEYRLTNPKQSGELSTLLTESVGKLLGLLAGVTLLTVVVKAIYGLTATTESTSLAYETMLLGSFAPIYWGIGILLGLVVPIGLMAARRTRTPNGVLVASVFVLVGLFVTRYEFVVGGQVVALTADPGHQYPIVNYVPSGVEIALVVFALAICAFVYTAGRVLFDPDSPGANRETHTAVTNGGSTNEH